MRGVKGRTFAEAEEVYSLHLGILFDGRSKTIILLKQSL